MPKPKNLIYPEVNILRQVFLSFRDPCSWMLYSSFHEKQLCAFPSTITKPWQPISALSNSSLTIPNISITMQIGPLSSAIGHLFSSEMLWFSAPTWVALKLFVKYLFVPANKVSPDFISINSVTWKKVWLHTVRL